MRKILLSPYFVLFYVFILAVFLWVLSNFVSVHPDFADHWVWSRNLFLSYYEHPPMVALFLKILTTAFGDSERSLFNLAIFVNFCLIGAWYLLCRVWLGVRTARFYVILILSSPYILAGSLFVNIDQPFMLFWLLCVWALIAFVRSGEVKWFYVMGIFAGLGALSKYSMVLFYFGFGLWLLMNHTYRRFLLSPHFYLSGVLALIIFSPVIYWNYQHDWISFKFQLKKGLTGQPLGANFLSFSIGHLLLFGLPVTVSLWYFLMKRKVWKRFIRNHIISSVLVVSLVPIVFFSLASLRGSISDPQWVNIGYLPLFMLLARRLVALLRSGRWILPFVILKTSHIVSWAAIVTFVLFGHYGPFLVTYEQGAKIFDSFYWRETSQKIMEVMQKHQMEMAPYVLTREYQLAGALSFYLSHRPWPMTLEKMERNQWIHWDELRREPLLLVCAPKECEDVVGRYKSSLGREFRFVDQVVIDNQAGWVIRSFALYFSDRNR